MAILTVDSDVNNSSKNSGPTVGRRWYVVIGVIVGAAQRRLGRGDYSASQRRHCGQAPGWQHSVWHDIVIVASDCAIRDAKIMRLLADHRTHSTVRPCACRPSCTTEPCVPAEQLTASCTRDVRQDKTLDARLSSDRAPRLHTVRNDLTSARPPAQLNAV